MFLCIVDTTANFLVIIFDVYCADAIELDPIFLNNLGCLFMNMWTMETLNNGFMEILGNVGPLPGKLA